MRTPGRSGHVDLCDMRVLRFSWVQRPVVPPHDKTLMLRTFLRLNYTNGFVDGEGRVYIINRK